MTVDEDTKVIDLLYQRLLYRIEVEVDGNFIPIEKVIERMITEMRYRDEEVRRFC
jgi:hypothetical protein